MPAYIVLSRLTAGGRKRGKDRFRHRSSLEEEVESLDGKVIDQFVTFGEFDFCTVLSLPNNAAAQRIETAWEGFAGVERTVLPAIDLPLFVRLCEQTTETTGPHRWQMGPRSPTIRDAIDANHSNSHPAIPLWNTACGSSIQPPDKTAVGIIDGVVLLCIMAVPESDIKSGIHASARPIGGTHWLWPARISASTHRKVMLWITPNSLLKTFAAIAGLVSWDEVTPLPLEAAVFPQSTYRLLRMPVVSYAIPALVAIGLARFRNARPWNPFSWIAAGCSKPQLPRGSCRVPSHRPHKSPQAANSRICANGQVL